MGAWEKKKWVGASSRGLERPYHSRRSRSSKLNRLETCLRERARISRAKRKHCLPSLEPMKARGRLSVLELRPRQPGPGRKRRFGKGEPEAGSQNHHPSKGIRDLSSRNLPWKGYQEGGDVLNRALKKGLGSRLRKPPQRTRRKWRSRGAVREIRRPRPGPPW